MASFRPILLDNKRLAVVSVALGFLCAGVPGLFFWLVFSHPTTPWSSPENVVLFWIAFLAFGLWYWISMLLGLPFIVTVGLVGDPVSPSKQATIIAATVHVVVWQVIVWFGLRKLRSWL